MSTTAKMIRILFAPCVFLSVGAAPALLEPLESRPKAIGGIEFSLVTQSEWEMPLRVGGKRNVVLQLRIRNPGTKPIVFPTFDSFMPKLTTPDGKTAPLPLGRDHTRITPEILLRPGKEFSYALTATLRYHRERREIQFVYEDGTGAGAAVPIKPGVHGLVFDLAPAGHGRKSERKLSVRRWSGKGATSAVKFKVVAAKALRN